MNCMSVADLKLLIQRYQEHDFDLPAMRDIRSKIIHVVGTRFDQTHAGKKADSIKSCLNEAFATVF